MSRLFLIRRDERLPLVVPGYDETTFYYRRLPADVKKRIVERNSPRGVTNWEAVSQAGLEYVLLDWDGVFEKKDGISEAVPFDKGMIKNLPDGVRTEIVRVSFEGGLPELGIEAEDDREVEGEETPIDPT